MRDGRALSQSTITLVARVAFVGALGFTFWSALTGGGGPGAHPPWDKILHFSAFYVLTLLAVIALSRMSLLGVALLMLMIGGAIEVAQLVPQFGRSSELNDLIADALGVAAALAPIAVAKIRRAIG
jgi:VanZ family protein